MFRARGTLRKIKGSGSRVAAMSHLPHRSGGPRDADRLSSNHEPGLYPLWKQACLVEASLATGAGRDSRRRQTGPVRDSRRTTGA